MAADRIFCKASVMLQSTLLRDLVLLNSRNREMEYCEGSNMRNVNVGILGCGVISNTYIRDIKRFYPTLHLAACADVNVELAKSHAEKYQISAGCSVEEMLAMEDVELVVNLTPPQLHTELNKKILMA